MLLKVGSPTAPFKPLCLQFAMFSDHLESHLFTRSWGMFPRYTQATLSTLAAKPCKVSWAFCCSGSPIRHIDKHLDILMTISIR
jgi:hypothetical protein